MGNPPPRPGPFQRKTRALAWLAFTTCDGAACTSVMSDAAANLGEWRFVVITKSGLDVTIYSRAASETALTSWTGTLAGAVTLNDASAPLRLGNGGSAILDAVFDSVAIVARVLTAAELRRVEPSSPWIGLLEGQ